MVLFQLSDKLLAPPEQSTSKKPVEPVSAAERDCDTSLSLLKMKLMKLPQQARDALLDRFINMTSETLRQLDTPPQQGQQAQQAQQAQPNAGVAALQQQNLFHEQVIIE